MQHKQLNIELVYREFIGISQSSTLIHSFLICSFFKWKESNIESATLSPPLLLVLTVRPSFIYTVLCIFSEISASIHTHSGKVAQINIYLFTKQFVY